MIRLEEAFRFDSPKVTAASGLILANDHFYCVSDDETSLSRFSRTLAGQVERIPLFDLALPEDPEARKKSKPDLKRLFIWRNPAPFFAFLQVRNPIG